MSKQFNPGDLTIEEQEAVLEHYLGIHPDYFIYQDALNIKVDISEAHQDGKLIKGFIPKLKQMGYYNK